MTCAQLYLTRQLVSCVAHCAALCFRHEKNIDHLYENSDSINDVETSVYVASVVHSPENVNSKARAVCGDFCVLTTSLLVVVSTAFSKLKYLA